MFWFWPANKIVPALVGLALAAVGVAAHAQPGRNLSDVPVAVPADLGALASDLVYTPVAPCRIVDTRSTASGPLTGGSPRSFVAINASSFASQGGSATNCGTFGLNATAVAVNITVVSPAGQGFLTLYPFSTTRPTVATMVYVAGNLLSNAAIVQIPNPVSVYDFTAYSSNSVHMVVDVVGFFAPPVATPVQCYRTSNTVSTVAVGAVMNVTAPVCNSGYSTTATNCESSSWDMPMVWFGDGTCSAKNNGGTSADLRANRTCCRVPGR